VGGGAGGGAWGSVSVMDGPFRYSSHRSITENPPGMVGL